VESNLEATPRPQKRFVLNALTLIDQAACSKDRRRCQVEVRFEDLSWPLKTAIIAGWIYVAFAAISFIFGFIQGFFGV
jgi:hypothetical protein